MTEVLIGYESLFRNLALDLGQQACYLCPSTQALRMDGERMKIGCGTVSFRKYSLDEAMERIARAGYQYVEPQATAPFCPHVDVDNDDPAEFARKVTTHGFEGASALWAPRGAILADPESVEWVGRAIKWASAAGIPVVNAGDGAKPEGMDDDEAWAVLADRLSRILRVAEEYEVFLAIEPHGSFSLTPDGLKRILSLSDSPWLGINYDTANVRRATYVETSKGAYSWKLYGERQDEVATLEGVIGRVVHFHVKDWNGSDAVVLGKGEVDLKGCLDVLLCHGYDGVASLETEGELPADEAQSLIEESRHYLARVLEEGC